MKQFSIFFIGLLFFYSCKQDQKQPKDDGGKGAEILTQVVEKSGSKKLEASNLSFNFRDKTYKSTRDCGFFKLQRIQISENGDTLTDILNNEGFTRLKNNQEVTLVDSMKTNYRNSVNSVHYFAQIPFSLNDPSVNKFLLGETTINKKPYYEVEVTFDEVGGGTDYEDVYVYWVNKDSLTIDYMAYSYEVNDGGVRFREAYNVRNIEGVRFADYKNYAPKKENAPAVDELERLFEEGKLKQISTIETSDIKLSVRDKKCN
ncbi:DUF6503 family protein [Mesonia aquimarina]|uniref:DUF6503 family protein n=1 Tax=Mesonia aquimarina TaxID=1504967 RepID=UPI000EF5699B|nr:DUF6503 family protein [Mesonia aquimarina]